jgi:hypothetical protein
MAMRGIARADGERSANGRILSSETAATTAPVPDEGDVSRPPGVAQ